MKLKGSRNGGKASHRTNFRNTISDWLDSHFPNNIESISRAQFALVAIALQAYTSNADTFFLADFPFEVGC